MEGSPAPMPPRRSRPAGGRPLPTPRLAIPTPAREASPNPPFERPVTPTPVRHPSLGGLSGLTSPTPPPDNLGVPLLIPPRPAHSRSATPLHLDIPLIGDPGVPNGRAQHAASRPCTPSPDEPGSTSAPYNMPTLRPPMPLLTSATISPPTSSSTTGGGGGSTTATTLADSLSAWTAHASDSEGSEPETDEMHKMHVKKWEDKDFEVVSRLGEGAGGSVDKVRERETGKIMARKTIPAPSAPEQQLRRELNFLSGCRHAHIVDFYGAYLSGGDSLINVLMEYCEGGSLEAVRDKMREEGAEIGEKVIAKIAEGCLLGLEYLRSKSIIHRDIKPSNILLTGTGVAKLIDFGVSGELVDSYAGTFTGTSYYMAPERIKGAKYSVRSDVWSLGLTLLELARTEPIYPLGLGPIELITYIVSSNPPRLDDSSGNWSAEMKDFIRLCLSVDPAERPSPKELLQHPWILESRGRKINLARWIRQVWQWDKPTTDSRPASALSKEGPP